MTERPYLIPFSLESTLVLQPAPNGGYIVYEKASENYVMDRLLGAFSSKRDMFLALTVGVDLSDTVEKTGDGMQFDVAAISRALERAD